LSNTNKTQPKKASRISDLVADPANCRKHNSRNIGAIQTSLSKVGAARSIAVRDIAARLRNIPFYGSGWKVIVCNEADRMSPQAEAVWLDVLEALPQKTVIVFTTNHLEKLSQRFRDRCERIKFTSDPNAIGPAIRDLVGMIWHAETGLSEFHPIAEEIAAAVVDDDGAASFRRAVQWVSRLVRDSAEIGGGGHGR
jgi:DNA polymerase III delta prime subunit